MILKSTASSNSGDFEKAPEGMGRGVLIDITPPEEVESTFNGKVKKRTVFKMVFELSPEDFGTRSNGAPYSVWSRTFTCSLDERSALRPFIESMLGRKLSSQELLGFDSESLMGTAVRIVVVHNPSRDGSTTFANIASIKPYKAEENGGKPAYVASGKYVRKQDRAQDGEAQGGASAAFRKADKPEGAERDSWMKCKIHVGKFAGSSLGDLDEEAFMALYTKWRVMKLDDFDQGHRLSADDRRLIAALEEGKKVLDGQSPVLAADADVPTEDSPY